MFWGRLRPTQEPALLEASEQGEVVGVVPLSRQPRAGGQTSAGSAPGSGQGPSTARGLPPQVILACNSGPALNDVTYCESLIVAERIAAMDPVVQ